MKNVIVGAGASGILAALSLKMKYPNDDVLVIEHTDKPLKKILATGNGKCNLGNKELNYSSYSNSAFVKNIISNYSIDYMRDLFSKLGFETKFIGNLLYPISESAVTVREALLLQCKKLGIKINVNETILDYSINQIKTNKNNYSFNRLIFATGGQSLPKSGSDGSIISLLKKHGYDFEEFKSGLCPIQTLEKTKELSGVRVKAKVHVLDGNKNVFTESGEVLFKDHGLSGIVIFNASSIIARNPNKYKIVLDLLENIEEKDIINYVNKFGNDAFFAAYLHPAIANYFIKHNIAPIESKHLSFTFDKLSDFEFSQISVGGIKVNQLTNNLESKLEKNVYFIGELVDVDGPCGGYNLSWAFASALSIK